MEAGEARMSAMIIFFSAVPASGISFWALFEGGVEYLFLKIPHSNVISLHMCSKLESLKRNQRE